MKIIIEFTIVIILLMTLISCNLGIGDGEPDKDLGNRILLFNSDGSEMHYFNKYYNGTSGNSYDATYGNIQFFNDNRHFALNNEYLLIFDAVDLDVQFILEGIEIDYNDHSSDTVIFSDRCAISYDDSLIAFTSGRSLYCLDLETNNYCQITDSGRDYYPAFGLDNKIYFCRKDTTRAVWTLMSLNPDGSDIEEYCSFDERINRILPGRIDVDKVFLVKGNSYFYQYNCGTDELNLLCEFPYDQGKVIDRSNDDNYFSFNHYHFSPEFISTFIYDTNIQNLYEISIKYGNCTTKIMPEGQSIFVCYFGGSPHRFMYLDYSNNTYSNEIPIEYSIKGTSVDKIDISNDCQKIVLITDIMVINGREL
ncbi:MAG: hypothetical protein RAO94_13315 [Candidatus Stygibacter australis]|nr:hypothetical protein [Candidatus Stygibacter australis]MDP8323322.1 hypothetical protein [Candidatus Stygibacter australis]